MSGRAEAVAKIAAAQERHLIDTGIVRAVRGQYLDVILDGTKKQVKDVIVSEGITNVDVGWWVVIVRVPRNRKWVAVAALEGSAQGTRPSVFADLPGPSNVTATAKPYFIELSWDGQYQDVATYEIQHNNAASEAGATSLKIEGSNFFYWCVPGTQRYFRVRGVTSKYKRSSWSSWVNATALTGTAYDLLHINSGATDIEWTNAIMPDRIGVGCASIPALDGVIGLPEVVGASVPFAPNEGRIYCADNGGVTELWYKDDQGREIMLTDDGSPAGGGGGGSLDDAYNLGRQITADAGAVELLGAGGLLSQGNIVLDDGVGNSPSLQFVGGSNDDTASIYLSDDPVAGRSDLIITLPSADGLSALQVWEGGGDRIWYVAAGGEGWHFEKGKLVMYDGDIYAQDIDPINGRMGEFKCLSTDDDAVQRVLKLHNVGSGVTHAAGFGCGIEFAAGVDDVAAIDVVLSDAGSGTEDVYMAFRLMIAGAAHAEVARLDEFGLLMAAGKLVDLQGGADAIVLDADGDTTISAPTDDQIDIECGGTDRVLISGSKMELLTATNFLQLNEHTGVPGSVANKGSLYLKDDSGDTELFYMDDSNRGAQITRDGYVCLKPLYDSGWVLSVAGNHTFTHNLGAVPLLWSIMAADDAAGNSPTPCHLGRYDDGGNSYGMHENGMSATTFGVSLRGNGYAWSGSKWYARGTDYIRLCIWATE